MPFQVVDNPPLQVIKRACEKLPRPTASITTGLNLLGRNHTTQHFSVLADGNEEIILKNESNNDTFPVTIHMALYSFHIDLKKTHECFYLAKNENGAVRLHKEQGFSITVADLFKLFYKQNSAFLERKPEKKNKRREDVQDEGVEIQRAIAKDEDEDRIQVAKLTAKALKVSTALIPDPRDVLGALSTWKDSRLRLWSILTKEGHLKKHDKNDFTRFCSMLVVLPMYCQSRENVEDQLPVVATYELMKKITRYYLYAEDPEVHVNPGRDFFDHPKSLADVCELYAEEFPADALAKLRKALTRAVNNHEKDELDTKYCQDIIFEQISCVEKTYPAYALRTISLASWCTEEDRFDLEGLIGAAVGISKSDKAKKIIEKRGKFQHYSEYENRSESRYRDYVAKGRKSNVSLVRDEATVMDKSKDKLGSQYYD